MKTVQSVEHRKPSKIKIRRVIPDLLNGNTTGDEPVGSSEWTTRANQADPSFPILIVKEGSNLWVADGNHRLWKAFKDNKKYILAHIIKPEECIKYDKL